MKPHVLQMQAQLVQKNITIISSSRMMAAVAAAASAAEYL